MLPCNVVVYDNLDVTSTVEVMDPQAALRLVGDNPALAEVAVEARTRLRRAPDQPRNASGLERQANGEG